MEHFDVIVIGGSVAGAPTAMLLARLGYKVILLEKSIFPRDTNSTHFIWPRGMSYLNRWGLARDILNQTPHFRNLELCIEGISLKSCIPLNFIKERFIDLHDDDRGVINYYCGPRRYFLDEYLLNAARKAGVTVCQSTNYIDVIRQNTKVIGVTAKLPDKEKINIQAHLVIGADGRFSKFAKDVNAAYKTYYEDSTFAYYSYFAEIDRDELAIHRKGRFGTAIFPTLNNSHMVLIYGPAHYWKTFKNNPEKNFFAIFNDCAPEVFPLLAAGKRIEKFKACSKMQAFQRQIYGENWVLIGDAASFKDQVTAMGITHAFRDAELITFYTNQALSGVLSIQEALKTYTIVRGKDYNEYFKFVCNLAKMEAYTPQEIKEFQNTQNDPYLIGCLLSRFADTLKW